MPSPRKTAPSPSRRASTSVLNERSIKSLRTIAPSFPASSACEEMKALILRSRAQHDVSKDGRESLPCIHPSRRGHRNRLLPISTLYVAEVGQARLRWPLLRMRWIRFIGLRNSYHIRVGRYNAM